LHLLPKNVFLNCIAIERNTIAEKMKVPRENCAEWLELRSEMDENTHGYCLFACSLELLLLAY